MLATGLDCGRFPKTRPIPPKAAPISAVPPPMVKTPDNPGGLPKEVFDGLQAQLAANRSQFYRDLPEGPFMATTDPRRRHTKIRLRIDPPRSRDADRQPEPVAGMPVNTAVSPAAPNTTLARAPSGASAWLSAANSGPRSKRMKGERRFCC